MTQAMKELRNRMHGMLAYRRTVAALKALSLHSRLDLDIAGIEKAVASKAVYGF
jgi:hypothetical protein